MCAPGLNYAKLRLAPRNSVCPDELCTEQSLPVTRITCERNIVADSHIWAAFLAKAFFVNGGQTPHSVFIWPRIHLPIRGGSGEDEDECGFSAEKKTEKSKSKSFFPVE